MRYIALEAMIIQPGANQLQRQAWVMTASLPVVKVTKKPLNGHQSYIMIYLESSPRLKSHNYHLITFNDIPQISSTNASQRRQLCFRLGWEWQTI